MSKRLGYVLGAAWLLGVVIAALVFRAGPEADQLLITPITTLTFAPASLAAGFFLTLRDLLAALLLIAVAAAVGGALLARLGPAPSPAEGVVHRFLVGLVALGLVMLVLGLVGAFPARWVAWLVLLAVCAALWRHLRGWLTDLRAVLRAAFAPTERALVRWLRVGVVVLVVAVGLLALAPVTAWDALMYHVAGGREYLAMGYVGPVADNYRLSLPAFVVMLYIWPQILATGAAAAVLNWAAGVALLLLMFGAVQRLDENALPPAEKPLAFWVACVLVLGTSTLHRQMGIAYADVIATAYTVAAVLLLASGGRLAWPQLLLAGAFTGALMSARMTGFAAAVGVGVLTLWQARRAGVGTMLRQAALVTVAAVVVFSPWVLKNLLVEGNAIAPYGTGGALYPASEAQYERAAFDAGGLSPDVLLLLPVQAAFGVEGYAPFQSSYNPVLLGLLPVFALLWKRRPAEQRAVLSGWLVFCGAVYAVWHITSAFIPNFAILRFIFPLFVMLALAESVALLTLPRPAKAIDLRAFGLGAVVVSLVAGVLLSAAIFFTTRPVPTLIGVEPREAYLTRRLLTYYRAMRAAPPDGVTVLLWEPKGYYCLPHCITDDALNLWDVALAEHGSAEAAVAAWRAEGVTYVMVNAFGAQFLTEAEGSTLTEADVAALTGLGLPVVYQDAGGVYTLYALEE